MSKWRTADGRDISLDEMTHQHASNIIWFYDIFLKVDHKVIRRLINEKFNGVVLPFKPLPIPNELSDMYKLGLITSNGDIIKKISWNKFYIIGSVTHIPNWRELIK